jgi:hypothetical protein
MAKGKCNSPYGPGYQRHMREWLSATGLSDLDSHERVGAIFMAEHERDISAWHAGLSEVARRNCNHPNSVLQHFRKGSIPRKNGPKAKPKRHKHIVEPDLRRDAPKVQHGPRLTRPGQDLIRRIAAAMRASGKQDWLALAVIAVETLTLDDLRDLMPAKTAPSAAIELHA